MSSICAKSEKTSTERLVKDALLGSEKSKVDRRLVFGYVNCESRSFL